MSYGFERYEIFKRGSFYRNNLNLRNYVREHFRSFCEFRDMDIEVEIHGMTFQFLSKCCTN